MPANTIEATLVNLIAGSAHLTGLIGTGDAARIYPARIPQDVNKSLNGHQFGVIVFILVNANRVPAFNDDTGLTRSRYQFSCYADNMDLARDIADGLRKTLQRYQDTSGTYGVPIDSVFIQGQVEQYDEAIESYGVLVDYEVNWQEGTV